MTSTAEHLRPVRRTRSTRAVARGARRRRGPRPFTQVFLYLFLAICTVASLLPTVWVMVSSFKKATQVYSGHGFLPNPASWQGYIDVFAEIHLQTYIGNSLLYAVGGTLGAVVVAFLAAYPLARYSFRGKNLLVTTFSLALSIPLVGLATPVFFVVRTLGLFDSRLGLVIFYAALQFPFTFIVLRSFLVSLPVEVEEAALIDGAGYLTMVRRIILPLSRPAVATVAVVAFVNTWNEFFFANLLTVSETNQNVQVALAGFKSAFGYNIIGVLAGSTLVMLVPVVLFLALQRQVIAGLTAGAVK